MKENKLLRTPCSAKRFSTVEEIREHVEGRWTFKKCPRCGSRLLTNNAGDEWCSYAHCSYGIEDFHCRACGEKIGAPHFCDRCSM